MQLHGDAISQFFFFFWCVCVCVCVCVCGGGGGCIYFNPYISGSYFGGHDPQGSHLGYLRGVTKGKRKIIKLNNTELSYYIALHYLLIQRSAQ